jgi:hypothetical protein
VLLLSSATKAAVPAPTSTTESLTVRLPPKDAWKAGLCWRTRVRRTGAEAVVESASIPPPWLPGPTTRLSEIVALPDAISIPREDAPVTVTRESVDVAYSWIAFALVDVAGLASTVTSSIVPSERRMPTCCAAPFGGTTTLSDATRSWTPPPVRLSVG